MSRRNASIGVIALLLCSSLLLAQQKPAPPKLPPSVSVTKVDGTVVKGWLLEATPRGVELDLSAKRADPPGEGVELLWADVKSVSNGMTRQRAVAALKQAHKLDLCGGCLGEGVTNCPTCNGTGHPAESAAGCPTCDGAQTVACRTPRCKDGTIPCPAPCLKLTEGAWVKRDDGLRWRSFPVKGKGSFSISEHHVGEVLDPASLASGSPSLTPCQICGKKGQLADPACSGTGLMPCPTDVARKDAPPCPNCKEGKVQCKTCTGYGLAGKGPR